MKMTKALLASCLFMAAPLMAADYDVDAAHTTVQFKVGHLGFSELVGRFNTFSGTFSMDDANPTAAKASFEIDAASVDSNHEARDKHLRSADFFDCEKNAQHTFRIKSAKADNAVPAKATKFDLTGELTIRGITQPIELSLKREGGENAFVLTGSVLIDREKFGITYNSALNPIDKIVRIDVKIALTKKAEK